MISQSESVDSKQNPKLEGHKNQLINKIHIRNKWLKMIN